MDEPQIQKETEGQKEKPSVEKKQTQDPAEDRIKKINDAADRLEEAERRLAERENSLREAEAMQRIGGRTNAGDPKLTPEEEQTQKAKQEADNIVNAFK